MTDSQIITQHRKSLIVFAQRCGNVAQACRTFGVSRTAYYELKKQYLKTGSLEPIIRSKPLMPNRTRLGAKKALLKLIQQYPCYGPARLKHELLKEGHKLSVPGIYFHLKRFGLSNRWKRLCYLEKINSKDGPLTQRTLNLFKQQRLHKIQADWPGDLIAQDTFYVGHLKGVGRIYQQTGIDCFSRYGMAKLYTSIDHKSSIDFVETKVIPEMYRNYVIIERLLTDNGSEYVNHAFNTMLTDYEVTHVLTKPGRPQSNGIVERFQRTILEEFYQKMFRTKFYSSLMELQDDLDRYLTEYNFIRPHQGLMGKYPIDLLKPDIKLMRQRFKKCQLDS